MAEFLLWIFTLFQLILKGSHWALFEVPTGMAVSETRENEQCLEPLGAVEAVERAVCQLVTGGMLC